MLHHDVYMRPYPSLSRDRPANKVLHVKSNPRQTNKEARELGVDPEDAEALALANDSPFGLLNGIWTNDLSRAHNMARDLESGMVSINEYPITFPQTAFTGWKQSGIGIEQSQDALRFYTKIKNVNVKL